MLDANEAYKIVVKNNPRMKARICKEQEKYYVFSLIPEDLEKGDGYGDATVYLVEKDTGKYLTSHFTSVWKNKVLKEYDVDELKL